jgi:hypothetical protein
MLARVILTALALTLTFATTPVSAASRGAVPPMPPHVTVVAGTPPGWTGPFTAASTGSTVWRGPRADRFALEHEFGHVFDSEVLTDADRDYFTRLMRLKGPWTQQGEEVLGQWAGGGQSPDEWFADWYANGRLRCGPTLGNCWTLGYADTPDEDWQFRHFLGRVQAAAAAAGLRVHASIARTYPNRHQGTGRLPR